MDEFFFHDFTARTKNCFLFYSIFLTDMNFPWEFYAKKKCYCCDTKIENVWRNKKKK